MDEPYSDFETQYRQGLLKGNSLLGWIRSLVRPNQFD